MPIPTQGQFDSLLGYSLKKDYLGDSFNWRNVETFTFTIIITDMTNIAQDSHGDNYLSAFIKNTIKAKYGADRNNITINSIELDMSPGDSDHLRLARYKVSAEVRSMIDEETLLEQHPELDVTDPDGGKDGEDGKFHGVSWTFLTYAEEIDSISETFDFSEGEDGKKDFVHTVNLTVRHRKDESGNITISSKSIAQAIANGLFYQDMNNTYFGHNAFSGALENYGYSANNKHYFSESYDQWTNQFSFTKKMTILPMGTSVYTSSKKYSLDITPEGKISVAETVELKSRNKSWSDLKSYVDGWRTAAYSRCSSTLAQYSNTIDGQGNSTSTTYTLANTLGTKPITESIAYNEHGLTITINSTFTNDVQDLGQAQFLETVDLNRDHKGVVQASYNVTLTSHRQKQLNADRLFYVNPSCDPLGACDDSSWTTEATCEGAGTCSDSSNNPVVNAHNNQTLCESVSGNTFDNDGNTWEPYDTEAKCDDEGGDWTHAKTALDRLKEYSDYAVTKICTIANYSGTGAGTTKGNFSNVLSWWWPTGGDRAFPFFGTTIDKGSFVRLTGCQFYPLTSSVSSPNLGKTFTLNMTFSNDAIYDMANTVLGGGGETDYRNICPDCFKKIEIKWQDAWPKRTINEYNVIGRGGLGGDNWIPMKDDDGNIIYINEPITSAVTSNRPKSSVVSDHFMTQAGKRTVTINAVLKRRKRTSNLTNPYFPTDELKALAAEAKNTLVQVFFHERVKNSYQFVAYISNINYTFNSDNQVTMTAELTYTYKAPPPRWSPNTLTQ